MPPDHPLNGERQYPAAACRQEAFPIGAMERCLDAVAAVCKDIDPKGCFAGATARLEEVRRRDIGRADRFPVALSQLPSSLPIGPPCPHCSRIKTAHYLGAAPASAVHWAEPRQAAGRRQRCPVQPVPGLVADAAGEDRAGAAWPRLGQLQVSGRGEGGGGSVGGRAGWGEG